MIDFYGETLSVLKANLHTHSTMSDGEFSPDELISLYAGKGYGALALTDHRKANRVSAMDGKGMVLVSGIELHPLYSPSMSWHLLALGVPESFEDVSHLEAQTVVDKVNEAGGICFVAHPYWCGLTSSQVMSLSGTLGIEVYNTSTRYIGKDYNMVIWDEILDAGCSYTALAVDDIHSRRDLFKGWTMIAASERTPEAIVSALRNGKFYASQGPEFKRLSLENGIFEAEFTPCSDAILLSNQASGFCGCVPDGDGPSSPEKEVTSIRFDVSRRPAGSYIRCQIRDRNGKYAWSNPVIL